MVAGSGNQGLTEVGQEQTRQMPTLFRWLNEGKLLLSADEHEAVLKLVQHRMLSGVEAGPKANVTLEIEPASGKVSDGSTPPAEPPNVSNAGSAPSARFLRLDQSIRTARAVEHVGRVQEAVNLVHGAFDDAFRNNDFSEVNQWLEQVDVDRESLDMLLSLLTATSAARSKLPSRTDLYALVARSLQSRGLLEIGLLDGLE